ncbi:hypothetical protein VPH35_056049 [Triticum aestivum]
MVGPGSEGSGMEECSEDRCWEDLARDALGLIFCKLSLQEILTVVPGVCKPWSRVVSGADCWQDIDIQEWSQQSEPDKITRMVHMLLSHSAGSCHRLSVSRLPNDSLFAFIADHAQSLKTLEIPRSEIGDGIVEDVAQRLTKVTFLDVSSCTKIGARALEAFGKNCKSLVRLRRVMHPMDAAGKVCHHDEARAIAYNMPKLSHLDLGDTCSSRLRMSWRSPRGAKTSNS